MATLDAAHRDRLHDGSFAWIDKAGERHLPLNDEGHVLRDRELSEVLETRAEARVAQLQQLIPDAGEARLVRSARSERLRRCGREGRPALGSGRRRPNRPATSTTRADPHRIAPAHVGSPDPRRSTRAVP